MTSNCYRKHLSLSKRILIEQRLNEGKSFLSIAEEIGKSNRTISYEIKKHRKLEKCNRYGISVEYDTSCPKTNTPPYVCNNCPSRKGCRKDRFIYSAEEAHMNYKDTLTKSRLGIDMSSVEFKRLNTIVTNEIKQGHSFYMIINHHKDEIGKCVRTLYNYVEKEYLDIINLDLPRKVRYKQRKKHNNLIVHNTLHRVGRTYQDFLKYIQLNPKLEIVEMDTVEGIKGRSCFLTLLFRSSNFLLIFKLENKTSDNVSKVFTWMKEELGNELFRKYFPIILTDNGCEFSNPDLIENNGDCVLKSNLFYCDPRSSEQKGKIEVTHEYIRRFLPKGTSFDYLTDNDIILMYNHINSVPRNLFNGQSPYQVKTLFIDDKFIETFQIKRVNNIILNKSLFNKKDTK